MNFKEFLAVHSFFVFWFVVCGFLAFRSLFAPLACRLFFNKKAAARLLSYPVILINFVILSEAKYP